MFFFNGRLGAKAAANVLLHPPHPALRIGKHTVGFKNFTLLFIRPGEREHFVHAHAQLFHRFLKPLQLAVRVVGYGIDHDNSRLVQPDMALGHTLLAHGATDHHRLRMTRRHCGTLAHESAKLRHFGQDHRNHFEGIHLIGHIFARLAGLDDQNAQRLA